MGINIVTGSKAIYAGPAIGIAWEFRIGVECTVLADTALDAKIVPVQFDCENKRCYVSMHKLEFTKYKTRETEEQN